MGEASRNRDCGDLLSALEELHLEVDRRVAVVRSNLGARITCHLGCTGCCSDDLSVFEIEASLIMERAKDLLLEGKPHQPGKCAFLHESGACRIYEHRPYVCRSHGLPIAWVEEREEGTVSVRDICELNEAGEPLETLGPEKLWEIGPFEEALQALQELSTPSTPLLRYPLRSLFDPGTREAAGRLRALPHSPELPPGTPAMLEASYSCDSCHEEIVIPVDPSEGRSSESIEDCPVCCRPVRLRIEFGDNGEVYVSSMSL